jgi:hypothetical protein
MLTSCLKGVKDRFFFLFRYLGLRVEDSHFESMTLSLFTEMSSIVAFLVIKW